MPEKENAVIIGNADLAVMATHNDEDQLVPASYTITYVDWVNEQKPQPRADIILFKSEEHEGWTETYNPGSKKFNGKNIYEWMLQYTTATEAALPVTLTSYKAYQSALSEVTITWSTAGEAATGIFTIERSATQNNFLKIAMLAAATQSDTYTYLDKNPLPGDNYYRLLQTEPDGSITYFPILKINRSTTSQPVLALYPNPVSDQALLQLTHSENGPVTLSVFNAGGMLLQHWTVQKETASFQKSFSFFKLPPGSYVLQAQGKTFHQAVRFIKR